MLRRLILAPVLVAAGRCAGCGDEPTAPEDPETPVVVSETFSGTVTVNGAFTQQFTVGRAGEVSAQIVALAPDDTVTLGFTLGTWNGLACQAVISNDAAKLQTAVLGIANAPGTLCVRIHDVGGLTAATTFDVTVQHF